MKRRGHEFENEQGEESLEAGKGKEYLYVCNLK